jgi:hypothetical protein
MGLLPILDVELVFPQNRAQREFASSLFPHGFF